MTDIDDYNAKQEAANGAICRALEQLIQAALPAAAGKVWHGHPVWFIDGNPVVGYSIKKSGVQVLFWSGQSFVTPGLKPLGSYQAAAWDAPSVDAIAASSMDEWLREALTIQWDYKNLPKKRGLEKLTDF